MTGQMSIFDVLYPNRIDPLTETAKRAGVYWTHSEDMIRKYQKALVTGRISIKEFARAVRHHYCPYGFAGFYGGDDNPNTMRAWEMRPKNIKTIHIDSDGKKQERIYSWEDFAREIDLLIDTGKYGRGHE